MKSVIIENGITYKLGPDGLYYPILGLPEVEARYGKYGRMCRAYLKEHRSILYSELLLTGKLVDHLNEIDVVMTERIAVMVREMARQQGVDESLKERDQMAWVRAMNGIRSAAEEIVLEECFS